MKIINPLGIGSTEVPVGNLVWVDSVNGVDGAAKRGRVTIPFRTITSALNAAVSGDTIVVLPGVYTEALTPRDLINFYFYPGASIQLSGAAPIFSVTTPIKFAIRGYGEFNQTGTGAVLQMAFGVLTGQVSFEAVVVQSSSGSCIDMQNGTLLAAIRNIKANSASTLSISNGIVELDCYRIESQSGRAVAWGVALGAGTTTIRAVEISSATNHAIEVNTDSSRLLIKGARIAAGPNKNAINILTGVVTATAVVLLDDCQLVTSGTGLSVFATIAATPVAAWGGSVSNKALGANVSAAVLNTGALPFVIINGTPHIS